MEGAGGDLQAKYHIIASEYSKVRAQLTVLKKAIKEEQAHNLELKELLREREQSLRKADQEADSLNFRNEQLTRRVHVLQDELDALQNQARHKKSKGKVVEGHHNSDFTNHVIDEEFRKKIAENAELLSLLHEKDEHHNQEVATLRGQVDQLQNEVEQLKQINNDAEEKFKETISRLEKEKNSLLEGRDQMEELTKELAQLRKTYQQHKSETESKIKSANRIINQHLPFIDSSNEGLNSLNIPSVCDSKHNVSSSTLEDAMSALQLICSSLAQWHSYTEARIHTLPMHDTPVNIKYSAHLKETADLALDLENTFTLINVDDGSESSRKSLMQKIPSQLASYCSHVENLLVLQRQSIEEEENIILDDNWKESNSEILNKWSDFVSHLVRLNYIVNIASKNKTSEMQSKHESELLDVFTAIHNTFKDLFSAYVVKSSLECSCAWMSEELKCSNEAITSCLSSLMESTGKLVSPLHDLWETSSSVLPPHPRVPDLRRRAAHYISSLQIEEAPSVPYLDALKDHEEAQNSCKLRETLLQQLSDSRELLVKSQQEKEYWKQEYDLLQLKCSNCTEDTEESSVKEDLSLTSSTVVTNMLGALECPINLPKEVQFREEEVKNYFQHKINKLIGESCESQSKAATYLAENFALTRRLELTVESNTRGEDALREARKTIAVLQEEVSTTASNYDAQLSTMSDHLATMNERLAQQKETIEQLEYQVCNKSNRKGKK